METTWRIKPSARWHDGAAVTAEDFVFTANVWQDPDVPVRRDPAHQLLENLRAADTLTLVATWSRPLRTTNTAEELALSVAGYWRRAGVAAEPYVVPAALDRDREFRANYPGFELVQQPNDLPSLVHLHGSAARIAPGYSGRNRSRYQNPEFDGLLDRYFATIQVQDRLPVLRQILNHMTEQLNVLGLVYYPEPTMINSRLVNVTAGSGGAPQTWNAEQWDVQ
jgi:ABC-type transport system substrate-binding protein